MRIFSLVILFISQACQYVEPKQLATDNCYGIDISHHQGDIDWNRVKEWEGNEIQFVYIKATEGATYEDPLYTFNAKSAKTNGLLVGSYHYFRTTSAVQQQFDNFISQVGSLHQDLIPMVDVEENNNWSEPEFHHNLQQFLDLIENHFGQKPMIYSVNTFYNKHLLNKYKDYHKHIGRYSNEGPWMKDGSMYSIWQFTDAGRLKGINKNVDINILNGNFQIEDFMLHMK